MHNNARVLANSLAFAGVGGCDWNAREMAHNAQGQMIGLSKSTFSHVVGRP